MIQLDVLAHRIGGTDELGDLPLVDARRRSCEVGEYDVGHVDFGGEGGTCRLEMRG